ncbi:binding--dependent transport system inner membrane component family protein [Listeria weihenstephanensis FSL R9-0317]|uniref:Sugar ABC transporter permease n=2 Tax=Listeria weihenstephanensis TaxID=1006155 RepID=A0A1S7FXJ6_9LIST|nr:sugar ABC transporter permease [Listeria weihenstephanensis]AQY52120.1 sugar ABC transporter permease [Listeria weihenstephanensis]EUJ37671.1 binding--dependent transport system inner membrane component family protein [Listeria weihenstephanensis FSL R9-0317]MBC1500904.1 sugar ABC transporter permease [Listeria weihenstephanensis]
MRRFMDQKTPYLFISPALLLLIMFSLFPIVIAFVISFTDINLVGLADWSKINFIGLENYKNVLSDPIFLKSIGNTLFYVIIGVPLVIICSLGIALMINFSQAKIFQFFRLIFYTPSITNVVAVAVVWSYLYNPQFGLFNYLLSLLDLPAVPWLQDPTIAKISLIILALWRAIGVNMIIFLAALQGIPREYYEAAQLDGANRWKQLTNVTVPLLRFAIFFVTVTTMIGWLQFFEEPFVMTQGGPLDSTTSVALFIYRNGFQLSKFGYAAAGSFILFIAIIIITIVQFKIQNRHSDTQM